MNPAFGDEDGADGEFGAGVEVGLADGVDDAGESTSGCFDLNN